MISGSVSNASTGLMIAFAMPEYCRTDQERGCAIDAHAVPQRIGDPQGGGVDRPGDGEAHQEGHRGAVGYGIDAAIMNSRSRPDGSGFDASANTGTKRPPAYVAPT